MFNVNIKDYRQPEADINPIILNRWSPRAFSGDSLSSSELMSILEAAKWAPSASNEQPWRLIYALNNTPAWSKFFETLYVGNQDWANKAAALVLIITKKTFSHNNKENRTAAFDAGAAWENLALEATSRNLIAHAMSGFDYETARSNLNIPEDYELEAMIALGRAGDKQLLPEKIRAREFPSDRKKIREIISEGEFKF